MATNAAFDWSALQGAPDYRAFLRLYLEARNLSLSDLARATGFGRGFPGDVIVGKRRLTPKSFAAFEKALQVPPAGKKLFRLLVSREERDIAPGHTAEKIEAAIEATRRRPWVQSQRKTAEDFPLRQVFRDPAVSAVYAASGQPGKGASLEEIASRTRLEPSKIDQAVRLLQQAGLLGPRGEDGRVEPRDLHLFFKAQDAGSLLAEVFQRSCSEAARRIPDAQKSEKELFFSSSFCVAESDLPLLKAKLRETVLQFVDNAIHPEGDRLVKLVTALHL